MRGNQDESGIVVSWLVKLLLFFAIVAVVLYDVGSILINNITLASSADQVAIAVSIKVSDAVPGTIFTDQQIYDLAQAEVSDPTDGVSGARVARNGTMLDPEGVVHIRLKRRAKTLVTKYISPLKHFTVGTGSGQSSTD